MQTHSNRTIDVGERMFFTTMGLATLFVVFAGFATSYYLRPLTGATHYAGGQPITENYSLLIHTHAFLFSSWVVLFITQTSLVARHRTTTHRRLGLIAMGLVPAMVLTGIAVAFQGARDGWNPGGAYRDALAFMIVGLADLVVFSACVSAGLWYRRRPDVHKRLMLLGTAGGLLWAAITRMPVVAGPFLPMFLVLSTLVLAPAARDWWMLARTRWLSLGVGLAILLSLPARRMIGNSQAWRDLAAWLIR